MLLVTKKLGHYSFVYSYFSLIPITLAEVYNWLPGKMTFHSGLPCKQIQTVHYKYGEALAVFYGRA